MKDRVGYNSKLTTRSELYESDFALPICRLAYISAYIRGEIFYIKIALDARIYWLWRMFSAAHPLYTRQIFF